MAGVVFKMEQRIAVVGKTRSGKTRFAIVLAGLFAQYLFPPWEIWWVDTKGDLDDLTALRQFGFRNGASPRDLQSPGAIPGAVYWHIEPVDPNDELSVVRQAQVIFSAAMLRSRNEQMPFNNVLIIVDEYVSVVPSTRSPGAALKDIFQRGGGLKTGIVGLTQEPTFVPRQLISQATHVFLFNLTLDYDIDRIKKMFPWYEPPASRGDDHGFYHICVDSNEPPEYFKNQYDWWQNLDIEVPQLVVAAQ